MTVEEEIRSCECGAKAHVRMEYSEFGPINNDKWHIECWSCGESLGTEKCDRLVQSPA